MLHTVSDFFCFLFAFRPNRKTNLRFRLPPFFVIIVLIFSTSFQSNAKSGRHIWLLAAKANQLTALYPHVVKTLLAPSRSIFDWLVKSLWRNCTSEETKRFQLNHFSAWAVNRSEIAKASIFAIVSSVLKCCFASGVRANEVVG